MTWENYPCRIYKGHISDQGYGLICINGIKGLKAHVIEWEKINGPVPDGLVLDHLCRNRACVNHLHLEPVTPKVNTLRGVGPTALNARKTQCKRGHELTGANLTTHKYKRACRICQREHDGKYKAKLKERKE